MLLLNPAKHDRFYADPRSKEIMLATIEFFENKGKRALKDDDRERVWYDPGFWNNSFGLCKNLVRDGLLNSVRDRFFPSTSSQGRWGSDAISQFFHF